MTYQKLLLLVTKKFATKCKLSRYLITQTFWNTNNGGIVFRKQLKFFNSKLFWKALESLQHKSA